MNVMRSPRLSTLPVEQAKEAIALLEKRIAEDFGYYISLGAELEFVVRSRGDKVNEPLGIAEPSPSAPSDYTPQAWRADNQRDDRLFPDSPYICYSYRESNALPPLYKYEAVISHRAIEKEDSPSHVGRGALLSRVVEATTAAILGDYRNGVTPANAPDGLRHKVSEIHVDSFTPDLRPNSPSGITCGLHINASINRHGQPIPMKHQGVIERAIKDVGLDTIYLLGTDVHSMKRYEFRNNSKDVIAKDDYIENALPGASSNPYYATLTTLAGIYAGLGALKGKPLYSAASAHASLGEHKLHPIAENAEVIFKHPHNRLRTVLNHLEHGRGDAFFATIEAHPPGTEMRRVTTHSTKLEHGI